MIKTTRLLLATCLVLPVQDAQAKSPSEYWDDTKAYVASPFNWDAREWAIASGVVLGIAASSTMDSSVRSHFVTDETAPKTSNETRDAIPLMVMFGGTLAVGALGGNERVKGATWDMGEAIVLTSLSTEVFKAAFGRLRPNETTSPSQFGKGGASFPSGHTSVAFAAAQVLADDLPHDQWGWRVAAYGLAGATAYARMDSNAHWLSDTVAGAALGIATGRFVTNRGQYGPSNLAVSVAPLDGGAMITFSYVPTFN